MPRQTTKTIAQVEAELETPAPAVELPAEMPVKEPERKYIIARQPSGLYYVDHTGGGVLPDELKSKFTSPRLAQIAIDKYLANQPKRPDLAALFSE